MSAESLAAADLTKVAWPGDAVATVAEGVDLAAAGADGVGATGEEAYTAGTHAAHEGARPALPGGIEPLRSQLYAHAHQSFGQREHLSVPAGVREVDAALAATAQSRYPDPMSNDLRDESSLPGMAWRVRIFARETAAMSCSITTCWRLAARGGSLLNCPPCFSEYAFFASLCQTEVRDAWRS